MPYAAARMATRDEDAGRYQRHRPEQPVRQWVLSFPFQPRFLFASRPEIMRRVLGSVYR